MVGGSGSEGSSVHLEPGALNFQPVPVNPRSQAPSFGGHRFAVSITFDDGYEEHLTEVCPALDSHGMKGTFFVGMPSFLANSNAWKLAHDMGHEIGNHTVFHPGPRNSAFNGSYNLESMTVRDMEWEIDTAQMLMRRILGVNPKTFAYPHGCHHVGHGATADSYYPLVVSRFMAARGTNSPEPNQMERCNLHMLAGFPLDGLTPDRLKTMLDYAENDGLWLVFHGHHLHNDARVQAVDRALFRLLLPELARRDCLVAPIAKIAFLVGEYRQG